MARGGIRVQVTHNRLPAIARQLPEAADVIVNQRRGPEMQEAAQRRARVDTGEMRDGIHWVRTGQGTGELRGSTDHDVHNEYGTRHMPAQPMFRPALEEVGPDIVNDLRRLEDFLR